MISWYWWETQATLKLRAQARGRDHKHHQHHLPPSPPPAYKTQPTPTPDTQPTSPQTPSPTSSYPPPPHRSSPPPPAAHPSTPHKSVETRSSQSEFSPARHVPFSTIFRCLGLYGCSVAAISSPIYIPLGRLVLFCGRRLFFSWQRFFHRQA